MDNQDFKPCSRENCQRPIDIANLKSYVSIIAFGENYRFCDWVCIINWWKETHGEQKWVEVLPEGQESTFKGFFRFYEDKETRLLISKSDLRVVIIKDSSYFDIPLKRLKEVIC